MEVVTEDSWKGGDIKSVSGRKCPLNCDVNVEAEFTGYRFRGRTAIA